MSADGALRQRAAREEARRKTENSAPTAVEGLLPRLESDLDRPTP